MLAKRGLASIFGLLAMRVGWACAPGLAGSPSDPASEPALRRRLLELEALRAPAPEDLDSLRHALQARSPAIQQVAVRTLGRLERPELVAAIGPMLKAEDRAVRAEAANALAQALALGASAANAAAAAWTLSERLGAETEPSVRAVLLESLGRLPYRSPDDVRRPEAVLAAALHDGPASEAALGAARGLHALARARKALAPETVARLKQALTPTLSSNAQAAAQFRRLCLAALVGAAALDGDAGLAAFHDPDPEVRRIAVAAALVPQDTADRSALIRVGLTDQAWRVRYDALRAYGRRLRPSGGCGPLVQAIHDASPHVQLIALDLLGEECRDAIDRSLAALEAAARDSGWRRAAHALVSLAKRSPDRARTHLPRLASHPAWQPRVYAARAAALAGASDVVARLVADPRDNVREAALSGLRQLEGHAADDRFISALSTKDYPLLITAARALEGTPRRQEAKLALLSALSRLSAEGRDTSRDPRLAILGRLRELGSAEDADALLPYLRDVDPRVAQEAALALRGWTGREYPTATPPWRLRDMPAAAELERLVDGWVLARVTLAKGGSFEVRLFGSEAPLSVTRVTRLASAGYYDGLAWHRVEPTFVIQGGSPGASEEMGDGDFMRDEVGMRTHARGTVGISTRGRDTGDAQWFINLVDNPRLDHVYTVIGEVVSGMDVVDGILEGDVIRTLEVGGPGGRGAGFRQREQRRSRR